jgi:hypothetical protein
MKRPTVRRPWLLFPLALLLMASSCETEEATDGWVVVELTSADSGVDRPAIGAVLLTYEGSSSPRSTEGHVDNANDHVELTVESFEGGVRILVINDETQATGAEMVKVKVPNVAVALDALVTIEQICGNDDQPLDPADFRVVLAELVE